MSKYQAYPEYKDSGVEWMGKIPAHWDKKRIKETASLINGYPFDSKMFEAGQGMPLVRIRDIRSSSTEVGFVGDVPKSALINNGDLLVGMDGDFNVAIWNGGLAALNQRVACVRASNHHLHKLIFYTLPFNMKVVNDLTYFTTVKHLSSVDILKSVYPFPPENELTKIVNFLDHETAKIDTLIDKQQQLIQLLKEKRQAVISHAVTKGLPSTTGSNAPMRDSGVEWLGEVPEHWVVLKVKYVAELTPKKSQITQTKEQTCSFVPMEKLKKDSLILDETRKISDVYDGYTFFEDEDVLLAKVTPCFENQNMVVARGLHNGIGFGSSEIFVLRCRIKNLNDFLYYRLQEEVFMTVATGEMTGAGGLKRVPSDFINNYPLALPPENERLEIVSYIQEKTLVFDRLIKQSEGAIELMQERRTALISAAVTGKIDVRHHVSRPSGNDTSEVSA